MTSSRRWQVLACLSLVLNLLFVASLVVSRTSGGRPRLLSVAYSAAKDGKSATFLVRFATPMDTDTAVPGELPVSFEPALSGTVVWEDARTAVILPATPVSPGQAYQVTPRPGLRDRSGRDLSFAAVSLRSDALRLLQVSEVTRLTPTRSRLALRFNGTVRPADLVRHLQLRGDGRVTLQAECRATGPTATPEIEFGHPSSLLSVSLALAGGLASATGGTGLDATEPVERALAPALRVQRLTSRSTPDGIALEFTTSAPIDADAALRFIEITPAVEASLRWAEWWSERDTWRLVGPFAPRTYYRVVFRHGLPTPEADCRLTEEAVFGVVTGDLGPVLELADGDRAGLVLPGQRPQALPVRFRNAAKVDLRAHRVYPNNLVAWSRSYEDCWHEGDGTRYGHFVGKISLEPGLPDNVDRTLNVPLEPLLKDCRRGLFVLSAQASGRHGYEADTRTLLLTDIGLGAIGAPGAVAVWTLSLKDGTPLPGCEVLLLSAQNQPVAQGTTGATGMVQLSIPAGPAEETTPFLAVARHGDDLAYLRVDRESARDLTPFRLRGRDPPKEPYEALVSTERGIARPGETAVVEVIIRDRHLDAAGNLPCEIRVREPRGTVMARYPVTTSANGLAVQPLPLPLNSRHGVYTVEAALPGHDGPVWGRTSLIVGDYRPDRIRCSLTLDRERYQAGETMTAAMGAAYYYGKAVGGSAVRFRATFTDTPFAPDGYEGFTFGDEDRQSWPVSSQSAQAETDTDGRASVRLPLPADGEPQAALRATVSASIAVPGGETVSATRTAVVHVYPFYLGIRPQASPPADGAADDRTRGFEWVCVTPAGTLEAAPGELTWELAAVDWEYALRQGADGRFVRDWRRVLRPLSSGRLEPATAGGRGTLRVACPGMGLFALRIGVPGSGARTAVLFWHMAGDGGVARLASPLVLPIRTDRPGYRPGDTATLTFQSPAAGHVVVSTLTDGLVTGAVQAVQAGPNRVTVTVPQTPLGTCTVALTLIVAPTGGSEATQRLFGLAALAVLHEDRRLQVDIAAPELVRPGETLRVGLRLSTGGTAQAASVHLLAVDEGILALTRHATPDPYDYFHGPRHCAATFADLYGEIVEDTAGRFGTVSTIGGDGMGALLASLRPEDVRHAVVLSRQVEVGAAGAAEVALELPDTTGELRLMAVAVSQHGVGSGERRVTLRSPLTVLAAMPRVVAPGDLFEVTATVTAEDAATPPGRVFLTLRGPGRIETPAAQQPLTVDATRGGVVSWMCRAAASEVGRLAVSIRAEAGSLTRRVEDAVQVRTASFPAFRSRFARVVPGQPWTIQPGAGLVAGSATCSAQVSAANQVETTAALAWLLSYPYGCLEQTASQALAVIALPERFPAAPGTGPVPDAMRCLAAAELPEGGFAMWPGGDELWLSGSLYACHFLMEAERSGVAVDPALRARTVAFLDDVVRGRATAQSVSAGDRAYALYLLATLGQAEREIARAMAAPRDEAPLVRLLAAAALARSGRAADAMPLLEEALHSDLRNGHLGWDFDSDVRRYALALCVLNDIQPDDPAVDRLVAAVRARALPAGHWGTTQNNALVVLALGRRKVGPAAGTAAVDLAGARRERVTGSTVLSLHTADLMAGLTVTAEGGPVFVAWQERGAPAALPTDEIRRGLTIRREYVALDGRPTTSARHGELVLVRLTLLSPQPRQNLVIADLLPGGLEIEDASLATRQDAVTATSAGLSVKTAQAQADRLVLCLDTWQDAPLTYEYHVRAVTRGRFQTPRVRAEAMYDPDTSAEAGGRDQFRIE